MRDRRLPITSSDIAMGNLDIKKIIVQQRSDKIVAFFSHTGHPGKNAFTATVKFYVRDEGRWVTSLRIYEGNNVILNGKLKSMIQRQLTKIFSPYFDELTEGHRPW